MLLGALALAASWRPVRAESDQIAVGLLLTYVGPTAVFARDEDKGARLLIEQVNKEGGMLGRRIEIVNYDTEGKADRAATLYRRLATKDNVAAVIGPDSIYVLFGMQNVPTEVKVMSVAAPGLYEFVKPENRPYIVSNWAAGTFSEVWSLAYLKEKFNATRVGMITPSDAIGLRVAEESKYLASIFGVDLAEIVSQPASDRDLLPSLRKLAELKPPIQGLFVFGSGPFANIAMNQAELAGIDVPIAYGGGNVVPALIKDLSPSTAKRTFLITTPSAVADSLPNSYRYYAKVRKFADDYKARYGEVPTLPAAVGYDMALNVVDGLRTVGPDREKLRLHIATQQHFVGAQGVEFRRSPANGFGFNLNDLVIAGVSDGQFIFKDYLQETLQKLKVDDTKIDAAMRKMGIILD